jgi:hypothetical protein
MTPIRTKTVTRFDAVREQISSAIRMFFLWDELVSAVTLAGAAERVLSDLQPQDGIIGVDAYSIRSMINLYIKEEHQKDAATLFRKDYDFFRHADRNVMQNNYELKESSVAWLIFTSIVSFEYLKQEKTMEMRAFYWWFMAKNPHWLKPTAPDLPMIMKMRSESREDLNVSIFWHSSPPVKDEIQGILSLFLARTRRQISGLLYSQLDRRLSDLMPDGRGRAALSQSTSTPAPVQRTALRRHGRTCSGHPRLIASR